jgi:small subunit ribosomal protein S18
MRLAGDAAADGRGGPVAKHAVRAPRKKVCAFCKDKDQNIDYKDTALLRKYLSDRGRIRARHLTGTCRQHQRDIAVAIKNSREVALLPYAAIKPPPPTTRPGAGQRPS